MHLKREWCNYKQSMCSLIQQSLFVIMISALGPMKPTFKFTSCFLGMLEVHLGVFSWFMPLMYASNVCLCINTVAYIGHWLLLNVYHTVYILYCVPLQGEYSRLHFSIQWHHRLVMVMSLEWHVTSEATDWLQQSRADRRTIGITLPINKQWCQ